MKITKNDLWLWVVLVVFGFFLLSLIFPWKRPGSQQLGPAAPVVAVPELEYSIPPLPRGDGVCIVRFNNRFQRKPVGVAGEHTLNFSLQDLPAPSEERRALMTPQGGGVYSSSYCPVAVKLEKEGPIRSDAFVARVLIPANPEPPVEELVLDDPIPLVQARPVLLRFDGHACSIALWAGTALTAAPVGVGK